MKRLVLYVVALVFAFCTTVMAADKAADTKAVKDDVVKTDKAPDAKKDVKKVKKVKKVETAVEPAAKDDAVATEKAPAKKVKKVKKADKKADKKVEPIAEPVKQSITTLCDVRRDRETCPFFFCLMMVYFPPF